MTANDMTPINTMGKLFSKHAHGGLYAWARWPVALAPHEHRVPVLIYVCCDLLSINKLDSYPPGKRFFVCKMFSVGSTTEDIKVGPT